MCRKGVAGLFMVRSKVLLLGRTVPAASTCTPEREAQDLSPNTGHRAPTVKFPAGVLGLYVLSGAIIADPVRTHVLTP